MVSEEQNLKASMLTKIEKYQAEIEDLSAKLHLPPYEQKDGLTIMQQEKDLRCVLDLVVISHHCLLFYPHITHSFS